MKRIVHLWNVSKFLEKSQNPEVSKLLTHYVKCCRELSDRVELPNKNFGPSAMCPNCGISWTRNSHKTRISSGKRPSKRMENLISSWRNSDRRFPRYLRTFLSKCDKNRNNKIVRICKVCRTKTFLPLNKPKRRKIPKPNISDTPPLTISSKKRKKRTKDRTAGLNISGCPTPRSDKTVRQKETPLISNSKSSLSLKTSTPLVKPRKLNLLKLKGIMNTTVTPSKKSKLHSFLQELS